VPICQIINDKKKSLKIKIIFKPFPEIDDYYIIMILSTKRTNCIIFYFLPALLYIHYSFILCAVIIVKLCAFTVIIQLFTVIYQFFPSRRITLFLSRIFSIHHLTTSSTVKQRFLCVLYPIPLYEFYPN
jgi:hypothetical protein